MRHVFILPQITPSNDTLAACEAIFAVQHLVLPLGDGLTQFSLINFRDRRVSFSLLRATHAFADAFIAAPSTDLLSFTLLIAIVWFHSFSVDKRRNNEQGKEKDHEQANLKFRFLSPSRHFFVHIHREEQKGLTRRIACLSFVRYLEKSRSLWSEMESSNGTNERTMESECVTAEIVHSFTLPTDTAPATHNRLIQLCMQQMPGCTSLFFGRGRTIAWMHLCHN